MKCNNRCIIGVPEGEEREKGTEKLFQEIICENFPNMGKEALSQIQEAQRVPYKINPRRNTLRHMLIKLAKRGWHDILNVIKGKKLQPRLLYPARLAFRFEGEIKSFTEKQKLREFSNTKTALQQILKGLLQTEKKRPQPETKIPQMTGSLEKAYMQ
uniref:L1 transposable element dsRBD-like domain-containing protein n=1 Tax=Sus scrofa TaxID=9823 RepID=A0A8D0P410_PIG